MAKNPRLRKRDVNIDSRKVNIGITLAAIGASLALSGFTYMNVNNYQVRYADNKSEIALLEGRLNDLKAESGKTTVKEIQQSLNSATKLGQQVADLQNTWGEALDTADYEAFQKSGNQSADALNTTRYQRLKELFVSSDNNGSQNWYPKLDAMKSSTAKWKFVTTTGFKTVKQNVMWQCVTDSGELYAYVTAVYNADENAFESVDVHVTSAGLEAQNTKKGA